jgi:hypothetical protein
MNRLRIALVLAALSGGAAVAQDSRDSDRRTERERWSHHYMRGPVYEPRAVPRVGDPDPYAPKVGAPDTYSPRAGDPNPYATRGGDPVKPFPQQAPVPARSTRGR